MAKDKTGVEAGEPTDEPTQTDMDAAVAAHNDAERNAAEAALEQADAKEREVHGVTRTRGTTSD